MPCWVLSFGVRVVKVVIGVKVKCFVDYYHDFA